MAPATHHQVPDRMIARLLVEQEVAARQLRRAAWYAMSLDDVCYRRDGHEIEPFDVVWDGWLSEDSLPDSGNLRLVVLPLNDVECAWIGNRKLDAVRELEERRRAAISFPKTS